MRVLAMLFMIAAVPAAAAAQSASDSTTSSADVGVSTSATIGIQSLRQEARDSQVPEQAVANVIAEGRAKGATNAQLLATGHATIQQLAAAKQAIVSAGRAHPSDGEIQQAATLMAQGATSAQVQVLAAQASADHSLMVAFSTVAALAARGESMPDAMAQVGSRLSAGLPDTNLAGSALQAGAEANSTSTLIVTGAVAGDATSAGMGNGGMVNASGQLAGSVMGGIR